MEGGLSRPFSPRTPAGPAVRLNGKIRAREVRVIGSDGRQVGVIPLGEAINMARAAGVDLVEIAPNAVPPVCRVVDFGKYRYELAKKEKESKKHQHANRVKEIQLSPSIDAHDFKVKLSHAIGFFCEDMKVKISLRFRGREMAHKEFGFQKVGDFIKELEPFAHPDSAPKLIGRGITVMLSPLPRAKRARNPYESQELEPMPVEPPDEDESEEAQNSAPAPKPVAMNIPAQPPSEQGAFTNNPFAGLNLEAQERNGP